MVTGPGSYSTRHAPVHSVRACVRVLHRASTSKTALRPAAIESQYSTVRSRMLMHPHLDEPKEEVGDNQHTAHSTQHTNKQPSERPSKQTNKQASKQTSKQASKQLKQQPTKTTRQNVQTMLTFNLVKNKPNNGRGARTPSARCRS